MRALIKSSLAIAELAIVILLAAAWSEEIMNVPLRAVVITALPAFIGIGLGAIWMKNTRTYNEKMLAAAEKVDSHPYLKELQKFFNEDMYDLFGERMHKDEIMRLHNNLPARLKFRSIMLHPLVETEMEDYEHAGCEQLARVPTPEPWMTVQENLMVAEMVRISIGNPLKRYNMGWREMTDYLDDIEDAVIRDIKDLADVPWPTMVHEDGRFRYQGHGSLRRRS